MMKHEEPTPGKKKPTRNVAITLPTLRLLLSGKPVNMEGKDEIWHVSIDDDVSDQDLAEMVVNRMKHRQKFGVRKIG